MFTQKLVCKCLGALFEVVIMNRNNPNIHQLMKGYTKCGLSHIMEYYSAIKGSGVMYYNMNEP